MKKELGTLFLSAAILGGCNTSPKPTEIPVDILVDCQKNPFDDNGIIVELKKDEIKRVGAITKSGDRDILQVRAKGDGGFDYMPETYNYSGVIQPGAIQIQDENILFIAAAGLNGNLTDIGISMTCIDAIPKTQTQQG